MNRSKRMSPVIRLAESREQAAAKSFSASERALLERRRKLADLIAYREEYVRSTHQEGTTVTAARLQELHHFLNRLANAISEQERLVELAVRNCDHKRRDWSAARGRTLALEKVLERYRAEERNQAARREQKEIDEVAQTKGLTWVPFADGDEKK